MKRLYVFTLVSFAIYCTSYCQIDSLFDSEFLDLGDGKILSSTLNESGDYVIQEFKVEVNKTGKYYLAAWVNGSLDLNGKKLEYSVLLNDEKLEFKLRAEESHPHAVDLGEQMIDLRSGENRIAFKTKKPFCPNVEFIKVSQNAHDCQISSEKYDQYITEISNHKKVAKSSSSDLDLKYTLPNPSVNYDYEMEQDFGYTYYYTLFIFPGSTFTFETKNATSDPVMHVFHYNYPDLYSWTNDDKSPGDYNSKIVANITYFGIYYVLIRKKSTAVPGICDLYINGLQIASNCAVSGRRIQCTKTVTETLNWFTADLTGDSHIWLEDQTGSPGEIIAYNDDCNISSDFNWGNNSRIRENTSTNVEALIVSSHSSYNPTGNCDLYMNCRNSSTSLPIQTDGIQANTAAGYNCFGWSGGRMLNENPAMPSSPWYTSTSELKCFDNYYANVDKDGYPCYRYGPPAMLFSRMGADATNGCVALWGTPTTFEHASVRKPANDHPHGYDWESKKGTGGDRFFHPRDAISGLYGSIAYYYKFLDYSGSSSNKSAIIPETASLSSEKQVLLKKRVDAYSDKEKFEELYESWKETWDNPKLIPTSSTIMYERSNQYRALLDYCKEKGKEIWPVIFAKYLDGEEINDVFLIEDLTMGEYSMVIDSIRCKQNEEARRNNTSPSQRTNVVNFIAFLLGELEQTFEKGQYSIAASNVLTGNQNKSFNVYPNPAGTFINIEIIGLHQTKVVISICDLTGKKLKSVSEKISGNFIYGINIEDMPNGTYLCKIEAENFVRVIKFNVIR